MWIRGPVFGKTTTIRYVLPAASHVLLRIYGVDGRLVRGLVEAVQGPGDFDVRWDGRTEVGQPAASGVYFYRLEAGRLSATHPLVIVR